jgi:hypothetical protein
MEELVVIARLIGGYLPWFLLHISCIGGLKYYANNSKWLLFKVYALHVLFENNGP